MRRQKTMEEQPQIEDPAARGVFIISEPIVSKRDGILSVFQPKADILCDIGGRE